MKTITLTPIIHHFVLKKQKSWYVILEYSKPQNAILAHVDDEDKKGALIRGTPGGTQNTTIINEPGLYSLILSNNRKWCGIIFGYSNTRDALLKRVDNEDKTDGVAICDSIGREQKPILINESGLYSLILSSNRKWRGKALSDHVNDEDKLNNESLSSLGQRGGWFINESDIYSLFLFNQSAWHKGVQVLEDDGDFKYFVFSALAILLACKILCFEKETRIGNIQNIFYFMKNTNYSHRR